MKVLIVDDYEDNRDVAESMLVGSGYTVETASNGLEALEKARQFYPDLIISDILMPEMDGYELCRAVKNDEELRHIPFIFYTATYIEPEDERLAMAMGASRFIIKPAELEAFLDTIAAVLKEHHEQGLEAPERPIEAPETLFQLYQERVSKKLDQKIRELKEKSEALARSEEKYRRIVEHSPLGIFLCDTNGVITECNDALVRIMGASRQALVGLDMLNVVEDEAWTDTLQATLRGEDGSYEGHFQAITTDANICVRAVASALRATDGSIIGGVVLVENITERKRLEQSQRLSAITFETQDGITITDKDGCILRVNQAFTEITGYAASEVIGENPRILKSGRHGAAFYQSMWDALHSFGRWEGEIWNRRRNGEIYPGWLTITAVLDRSGETTHYVGVFSDQSEVKNQQRRIERNAAEEYAIGQLLELSLQDYSLEDFLQQALEMLLSSISWLNLEQRGGIFLSHETEQGEALRLLADYNLPAGVVGACQEVQFGTCLCGIAAAEKELQFASCVDERHHVSYPDMAPHGHYNVPILSGDELLGVIVLYLRDGHGRDENEVAFLRRVADVISAGIARRRADAEIQHLAYHDRLTGLANRLLLEDHLVQVLAACERHGHQAALLHIDLDRFKNLNDAIGHSTGDLLLRQVAERLTTEVRAEETLARLGSDEFVVLLPQLSHDPQQAGRQARDLAQKVHATLSRPYDLAGFEYRLTLSIGINLFAANANSAEEIMRQAEIALNRAKDEGRNAIRFYRPEMQAAVEARVELESDLRQALERDELELYYQPQVNQDGQIVGAEALLRWRHPERGIVSPGEFIPVAEETGLILPMGEWVLASAAAQCKAWAAAWQGSSAHYIAVNVSPRQFHQADYVEQVEQVLAQSGVPPEWIKLEITENVVLADVGDTIAKMQALKARGLRLAIDDFGTGYSSLSYLRRLPLNQLKIDRSFVQDVTNDPEDAAIVEMIIQMSHRLGMEVVAEGVETAEQFAYLKAQGCELFQGFYFHRPMPADQFEKLLRSV